MRKLAPHRFVLDGEIAVPVDGEFAFDALLQRIHPSDSRVRKLATETPAIFLVFDLLDGVMAKRLDAAYASGERTAMQKIKRMRTADCVVGGFRWASGQRVVGSLLLGLYDQEGVLHHVGFTSTFKATEKAAVLAKVEPLMGGEGFSGNAPGGPSRWSTERTGEWEPLAPALVCEVRYDHWSGDRFRHGTTFRR